jgi:hypothetical protein
MILTVMLPVASLGPERPRAVTGCAVQDMACGAALAGLTDASSAALTDAEIKRAEIDITQAPY